MSTDRPVVDLIDLDRDSAPGGPPRARVGRRGPAVISVLVAVIVVAVLTGRTGPPPLTPAWRFAMTTPYSWLTADAVYTVDLSAGVALVARDPGNGQVRWRTPLTGLLASTYLTRDGLQETRFPPYLDNPTRTTVVSTGPERISVVFPAYAMPLVQLADGVAIVVDRDTAEAPDPAATTAERTAGLAWAHRVTALDLRTGSVRWTRELAAGVRWSLPGVRPASMGIVALPPGADWMVTSTATGAVSVWDVRTGALRVSRQLGPLGPESYVMALADTVLVRRRGEPGATGQWPTIQLLDPATLADRATFEQILPDAEPLSCAPALCFTGDGATVAVDPAAGGVLARITGSVVRPGPGGHLLATGYARPLSIVDVLGGRSTEINDWLLVDRGSYGGQVVVADGVTAQGQGRLALLDIGTGALQPFGPAADWSSGAQCQASPTTLACTNGTLLQVWRR